MKVLLISPPIEVYFREQIAIVPPLGLAYLAAVLEREGIEVKIIDSLALTWSNPKIKGKKEKQKVYSPGTKYFRSLINRFKPEVIGISIVCAVMEKHAFKIAHLVKKIDPKIKVVVGGGHATAAPQRMLEQKAIDFVVIGEGEENFPKLLKNINSLSKTQIDGLGYKKEKSIIINPKTQFVKDLDQLPFPAWHLLPMDSYFAANSGGFFRKGSPFLTMITSRGCPNRCIYCTVNKAWGNIWRARSPENVLEEIKTLVKRYKIQEIQFLDDNISVDRERFIKIAKLLIKNKINLAWWPANGIFLTTLKKEMIPVLKKSGCFALIFGIEHGDFLMQKQIGKIVPLEKAKEIIAACKKEGIWTHGSFIIGLPGETLETAQRSINYAIQSNLDSVSFFAALPLPGSSLFERMKKEKKKVNFNELRLLTTKVKTSNLTPDEITSIRKKAFLIFFLHRLKREINPRLIYYRLKQFRFLGLGFYSRIFIRFVKILS